ncbi:MAG: BREX-2 system adenine-specific DNA-methyltransferase PglX, partial [Propionicimonas sp.]
DLYQDLSEYAKKTFALLQTPEFVEEFILDQTLEPALAERPLEDFRLIDPACGSGHFLLGAFRRLVSRWAEYAPGLPIRERVQRALDAVNGVDLNPFAVAISRFRLTLAAVQACGESTLDRAPAFRLHLESGDSLLHGHAQTGLEFGSGDPEATGFAYFAEDIDGLREVLHPGRYDVVVGNPPYITVKDRALNQIYRTLYNSCKGAYQLTVPFIELFYELAKPRNGDQPAGWTGQIAGNGFMKREFGTKLIEEFLVRKDLVRVIDTAGAYIPGHGTPTAILIGRNQPPLATTVRAVLGIQGEPSQPTVPREGVVWRSIVDHIDDPGHEDRWVSIVDLPREHLATHPWSLTGGGADHLKQVIERDAEVLSAHVLEIGRTTHTGNDEAFLLPKGAAQSRGLQHQTKPIVLGEDVRDYSISSENVTILPYDDNGEPVDLDPPALRHLWRVRRHLETQLDFGQTKAERSLRWCDHSMFFPKRFRSPLSLAFAFV